jgi:hypothetical protein
MRDFLRFVLRGSWASAIFTLLLLTVNWGSLGALIFLNPAVLMRCAIPGAIVGVVLWIVSGRTNRRLPWIQRVVIGTLVGATILFAFGLYEILTTPVDFRDLYFMRWITVTLIYAAGFGGLAGSACPSQREDKPHEDHLTYRERAKLYEAAEQEAKAARERIQNLNNRTGFNHFAEG